MDVGTISDYRKQIVRLLTAYGEQHALEINALSSGGVGSLNIQVSQPDSVRIFKELTLWHDDNASARDITLYCVDGQNTTEIYGESIADNVLTYCVLAKIGATEPLLITPSFYYNAYMSTLGAGKRLRANGIYVEILGVSQYL